MKRVIAIALLFVTMITQSVVKAEVIVPSLNYVTKQVDVTNFYSITTCRAIDVKYEQHRGEPKVEIYASDNVIEYIKVNVRNGKLKIDLNLPIFITSFKGSHKMEVHISSPTLSAIEAYSNANVLIEKGIEVDGRFSLAAYSNGAIYCKGIESLQLDIIANSNGAVDVCDVDCDAISVNSNTAGEVVLEGRAQRAELKANTGGKVKSQRLKAENVVASANTGGEVDCYASKSISTKTNTGGSVDFKGDAKIIE